MDRIVVVDYDPAWPTLFEQLRASVWPAVADVATSIEHLGSTAVPGLAAKPIIDMTVVVPSPAEVAIAIERLRPLGYIHRGDLGIAGREAFHQPRHLPAHHLYLCPQGSLGLVNPLALRDHLRAHPEAARAYGQLKKRLAERFPHDIDAYIDGKTDLIIALLRATDALTPSELETIERANRL